MLRICQNLKSTNLRLAALSFFIFGHPMFRSGWWWGFFWRIYTVPHLRTCCLWPKARITKGDRNLRLKKVVTFWDWSIFIGEDSTEQETRDETSARTKHPKIPPKKQDSPYFHAREIKNNRSNPRPPGKYPKKYRDSFFGHKTKIHLGGPACLPLCSLARDFILG